VKRVPHCKGLLLSAASATALLALAPPATAQSRWSWTNQTWTAGNYWTNTVNDQPATAGKPAAFSPQPST
jgi:hypothetical protein